MPFMRKGHFTVDSWVTLTTVCMSLEMLVTEHTFTCFHPFQP